MRKAIILTLALLLSSVVGMWAQAVGSWRSHMAYHNATQCVAIGDKVYVVSDGSLYSYTPQDEFIECYDKANLLSDQGICHIAMDEQTTTLLVIYSNANIDLIHPDGSITNISDFANESTLDPSVNGVCLIGGKAYLATNFGATILDIAREEFESTFNTSYNYAISVINDFYYTDEQRQESLKSRRLSKNVYMCVLNDLLKRNKKDALCTVHTKPSL